MSEKPAILGGKPVSHKKIKFVELIISEEEKRAVQEILEKKTFASGEYVEKFEKEFASFIGSKYAVSISNGTDALFLSYVALGLTFGKKIITTPLTFIATASSIVHAGAIPYFVDVERDHNISPSAIRELVKKEKIDGITVVHMYGKPVKMDEIREIAEEKDILIVEDAAHAHGAEYKGKKSGVLGDIAAFSLYPTKIIPAGGWGGVITTNDNEIYEKLILLRAHGEKKHLIGSKGAYLYSRIGYNMRMSHIEAAIAYFQLRRINEYINQRRRIARILTDLLADIEGVETPTEEKDTKHVYYIYAIVIDEKKIGWKRDEFVSALNAEGIEARSGYIVPLHKQDVFRDINNPEINHFAAINKYPNYYNQELPMAELLSRSTIWLPMHPKLTEEDAQKIAEAIKKLIDWKKEKS